MVTYQGSEAHWRNRVCLLPRQIYSDKASFKKIYTSCTGIGIAPCKQKQGSLCVDKTPQLLSAMGFCSHWQGKDGCIAGRKRGWDPTDNTPCSPQEKIKS